VPRIVGVDIPNEKRIEISLTYIHGIGRTKSTEILQKLGIDPDIRAGKLGLDEINRLNETIQGQYLVEGDLRREVSANIKRLMQIHSYRGMRHRMGLPTRGQRTSTNARTRKGPKRAAVAIKKKI
jgi:small subunit ribosomal protein S13